jgi:hypothetical protein
MAMAGQTQGFPLGEKSSSGQTFEFRPLLRED